MPEYLTPGVYMEEFEIGARPIEGVSTSTTGFLGLTERGITNVPRLVTSFTDFNRTYGGYIEDSYLAYAVDGFFSNGGQRCFIGRIVKEAAVPASKTIGSANFKAIGEGLWGIRVGVKIEPSSSDAKLFKLTVAYSSKPEPDFTKKEVLEKSYIEVFDNLSDDPDSQDFYLKKFGDPILGNPLNNLSNIIIVEGKGGRPDNTDFVLLENGSDGDGDLSREDFCGKEGAPSGQKRGLAALGEIDEISIVYVPDLQKLSEELSKTLVGDILTHCENLKDRFAILDIPTGRNNIGGLSLTSEFVRTSKYAAAYYPWIKVFDPLSKVQKLKPPGGYIAGIYARSDNERGVHKAPANEQVRGAMELEFPITKGDQGMLNPKGINVIRFFPGRGILVWGARTAIIDPLWKYINVRRLFIFIEKSIEKNTQWVVFEPNNEKLWARVRATITQFLTKVWKDGALMGTKAEEAFFVKCDRTTMTQDEIDNGKLICVIGIAPVKPAEFVIFRIAQWQGGSAATE